MIKPELIIAMNNRQPQTDPGRVAMGKAISMWGAGLSKPGYGNGLGGALAAANSQLPQALEAYHGEMDKARAQQERQQALMQQQMFQLSLMREQQAAREQARQEEMALKREQLAEQQRHHFIKESSSQGQISPVVAKHFENKLKSYDGLKRRLNLLEDTQALFDKESDSKKDSKPVKDGWRRVSWKEWGFDTKFGETSAQAELEKLSGELKGQSFKDAGFSSQKEFESIKHVDPFLSRKANKAIIRSDIKRVKLMLDKLEPDIKKYNKMLGKDQLRDKKITADKQKYKHTPIDQMVEEYD